jgi:hypothetical protein
VRGAPGPERFPLERLEIEPMASGHQSLRLTRQVEWEALPEYAQAVVAVLGGAIVERVDSFAERVWTATIGGASFWIALDDWGLGVSLNPQDAEASRLIPGIRDALVARREGRSPPEGRCGSQG